MHKYYFPFQCLTFFLHLIGFCIAGLAMAHAHWSMLQASPVYVLGGGLFLFGEQLEYEGYFYRAFWPVIVLEYAISFLLLS